MNRKLVRHLLRNATRLLALTDVGGIKNFSLVGSRDDESLFSSTASSIDDPHHGSVGRTGSLELDDDSIGNQTPTTLESSPSADRTGMECRIHRLEVGRKRAEAKRRAAGSLKLANDANRYRQMRLTCDASVLATATSAFQAMVNGESYGRSTAVGLGQEHMLALQITITQAFSGENSSKTHTTSAEKTGHSKGSEDTAEDQSFENAVPRNGKVSTSRRTRSTTFRGGKTKGGATLDELLEAMAGLAKHTKEHPIGLTTFVAWWLGATSNAEIELKNRFLNPTGS